MLSSIYCFIWFQDGLTPHGRRVLLLLLKYNTIYIYFLILIYRVIQCLIMYFCYISTTYNFQGEGLGEGHYIIIYILHLKKLYSLWTITIYNFIEPITSQGSCHKRRLCWSTGAAHHGAGIGRLRAPRYPSNRHVQPL